VNPDVFLHSSLLQNEGKNETLFKNIFKKWEQDSYCETEARRWGK
jgi:hypothetical protein